MKRVLLLILSVLLCQEVSAGPAKRVAESVGDTVSSTAQGIGKAVGSTAERLSGNVDVPAARAENAMADSSLKRLFKLKPAAKSLFERSYGYAVFDSRKTSFIMTIGRGAGVAVEKSSGKRTYMQMAGAGANVGAGIKFFQHIIFFENHDSFRRFVDKGWEAGTSGNLALGENAAAAEARFIDGMALYQLSDTGVMLSADITGSKYWEDSLLNG